LFSGEFTVDGVSALRAKISENAIGVVESSESEESEESEESGLFGV
jgi:hypothetical protein